MASLANYEGGDIIAPNEELGTVQFKNFIDSAINFKNQSEWKGDKRFFVTFLPNSASVQEPTQQGVLNHIIRTIRTGSFPDETTNSFTTAQAIRSTNLAELSTIEIIRTVGTGELKLSADYRDRGNQNYGAVKHNASHGGFHLFSPTRS